MTTADSNVIALHLPPGRTVAEAVSRAGDIKRRIWSGPWLRRPEPGSRSA